jgi:hypothetical protein
VLLRVQEQVYEQVLLAVQVYEQVLA